MSSPTVIFPLELLLDLLRVGTIRTHESQQPLLQVGGGAETKGEHADVIQVGRQTSALLCYFNNQGRRTDLAAPSDDGLN